MEGINIRLVCWEDGEKVEKDLDCTDRWTLHSAVELQVGCPSSGVSLQLGDEPREVVYSYGFACVLNLTAFKGICFQPAASVAGGQYLGAG